MAGYHISCLHPGGNNLRIPFTIAEYKPDAFVHLSDSPAILLLPSVSIYLLYLFHF